MKKAGKLLAASLVTFAANIVMAETGAWYVGIGAGQSNYHDWATKSDMLQFMDGFGTWLGIDHFTGTRSASADDTATAYKIFGGYTFNQYIAAELSYLDLGEVEAKSRAVGTFYDVINNSLDGDLYATAKASINAFTLDAKLSYPVLPFATVMAKAGVYSADTDLKLRAGSSISTDNYSYSKTESSSGLHYGVGVDFKVTDAIGVRAEWERLDGIEANQGKNDVDLMSASVIYRF